MTDKLTHSQGFLPLIEHQVESTSIDQRATDGYVNATALCQVVGKRIDNYYRLPATKEFLNELSNQLKTPIKEKNPSTHISATALIQVIQGGSPQTY